MTVPTKSHEPPSTLRQKKTYSTPYGLPKGTLNPLPTESHDPPRTLIAPLQKPYGWWYKPCITHNKEYTTIPIV